MTATCVRERSKIVRVISSASRWLRYGRPRRLLHSGTGLGDNLLMATVAHEFHKRGITDYAIMSRYPELFMHNPCVRSVIPSDDDLIRFIRQIGGWAGRLTYGQRGIDHIARGNSPEHIIVSLCRDAGLSGSVHLRPYVFLSECELSAGRLADNQIVIHSTGLGGSAAMLVKEWFPERFQSVVSQLGHKYGFIQLGVVSDPPLIGALDLRGKTSIRQSAAILHCSVAAVCLEGFVSHLARAVDCRAVIIMGGRSLPCEDGYAGNENLYVQNSWSPCWQTHSCPCERSCMNSITVDMVMAALERVVAKNSEPLPVDVGLI